MTDPAHIEALHNWNRLSRENAENAIVSSMFEASSGAIEPIDTYSTWLLVGAAAIASFLVGNADKLMPIIGKSGFLICGLLLCASCLFGVISKTYALRGRIDFATGTALKDCLSAHLNNFEETESQIKERAASLGMSVETGIRMDRVIGEFLAPLPWWARWTVDRNLRKYAGNPQIGHISRIKKLNSQGVFTFLQAAAFLLFLFTGFISAALSS